MYLYLKRVTPQPQFAQCFKSVSTMSSNDFQLSIKCFVFFLFICRIKYCSAQWKYNTETGISIITEEPATATRNIITGASVAVTTAATGICATMFWNPAGLIACGVAAIAGTLGSVVAPMYIAPDWRYVNCSSEQYRDRAFRLISSIPENNHTTQNLFAVLHYLNKYCAKQCEYPTGLKPVGGDRCSGDKVKKSVAKQYFEIRKEVLGDYDAMEFRHLYFDNLSGIRCGFSDQVNCI